MDHIDWKYDKGSVIVNLAIQAAVYAVLTIAVGFLLHVGWNLYEG